MLEFSLCLNVLIEGLLLIKSDSDKLTYAERNFPTLISWTSHFPFVGCFDYYILLLLLLILF